MKYLLLTLLLLGNITAQADGIHFEKELSFQQALDKAKKENKLLYIDFFTTWCGPCKIMAKNYFPTDEAGEVFNTDFISLKVDAEKGEGMQLAKKYEVRGYPTSMFLDPTDASVVHVFVGCPSDLTAFIKIGKDAMAEYKDPMTMEEYIAIYDKGDYDEAFIFALIEKANRRQIENTPYLETYYGLVEDKLVPDSAMQLLYEQKANSQTKFYGYVDKNFGKTSNQEMGKVIMGNIAYNDMMTALQTDNRELYNTAKSYFKKYNPEFYDIATYQIESKWYRDDPVELKKTIVTFGDNLYQKNEKELKAEDKKQLENAKFQIREQLESMGIADDQIDSLVQVNLQKQPNLQHLSTLQNAQGLNQAAWSVYENYSDDKTLTTTAEKWAKRASELALKYAPESWPAYADTQAHLLGTLGKKTEAIKIQTQVVQKAKEIQSSSASEMEQYLNELKK